ncbi:hypothetical protein J437_LFUL012634 [Ladona fulva]|uniref:ISXO2-like transposase domain-containing protein n=1 Tax=Ladona fulva TaxID=123851 RepID=A0A8K0P4N8_LADFU|nr:hypothetical protein J437_LFUL012634 [Ladona fulva]
MSSTSFADWSNYVREVCREDLRNQEVGGSIPKIGGEGLTVEVDETLLGRRKSCVGRPLMGQWVLGGIERGSRKVFLTVIPNRTADTLAQHIRRNISPGTTIITDCWKGYGFLSKDPDFNHLTVNHAENFVDPATGAHTQNIERVWREVKSSIPKFGRRMDQVDGYLEAYQWMRMHSDRGMRLHHFFASVARVYPLNFC